VVYPLASPGFRLCGFNEADKLVCISPFGNSDAAQPGVEPDGPAARGFNAISFGGTFVKATVSNIDNRHAKTHSLNNLSFGHILTWSISLKSLDLLFPEPSYALHASA
jgi:hypothetical protein